MSYVVRLFGYRGLYQVPQVNPAQYTGDAVFVNMEPYEWRTQLTASAVAAAMTAQVNDKATVVLIDIPDGNTIRYEVRPPGRTTAADANSPAASGRTYVSWGAGWTISILDAAGT